MGIWVTHERIAVDRTASAWLIKRFVDPQAEFLFVPKDQVPLVVERNKATPFHYPGVALGHVDGRVSFESIILAYSLSGDRSLVELGKIVHAADLYDSVTSPYAAGLKAIVGGLYTLLLNQDARKIEVMTPVYEALYEFCTRQIATNPDWDASTPITADAYKH